MKHLLRSAIVLAFIMLISTQGQAATTRVVPDDVSTIQAAINASGYGDTVYVKSGTYSEHITLKSYVSVTGESWESTNLYGGTTGTVVTATNVTSASLSGFTIYRSGTGSSDAGILLSDSNVLVSENRIVYNTIGIRVTNGSSPVIRNNLLYWNSKYGLYVSDSEPLIVNNQVNNNTRLGIYVRLDTSSGTGIVNNTFKNNGSYGISCYLASPLIKNNIVTENNTGIRASGSCAPKISYNCVYDNNGTDYYQWGGAICQAGIGDISEDPLLSGSSYNGYYPEEESPCIDTGDPDPAYNDIDGTRCDMGAGGGWSGSATDDVSDINSGFMYTSIGKIPVSEITSDGLADVSAAVAGDLSIYEYDMSPFGGSLWLNGQFGYEDSSVRYYQVLIGKWDGASAPDPGDFEPLTETLTKIRYTIKSDGSVQHQREHIGPLSYTTVPGLYKRTNSGYYAHPDLKLILNTRNLSNGKYDIYYKAYSSTTTVYPLTDNANSKVTLVIDNSGITTEIHEVSYSAGSVTPCDIITLDDLSDPISFRITVSHPNGYLKSHYLKALYGDNESLGNVTGNECGSDVVNCPNISNQTFSSADAGSDISTWEVCAYQFDLYGMAKTTDGFRYIYGSHYRQHYYIQD